MKLAELFENNPISFIDEMVDNSQAGDQPFGREDVSFDVAYSRPIGTFNGLEIWGSKFFGKKYDLYGILNKERDVLAYAVFDLEIHPGYSTFIRAWVKPEERGKNHTLTIINFLTSKGKEKVMIDKKEVTSSSSRNMFKKWFSLTPQYKQFTMSFYVGDKKLDEPNIEKVFQQGTINDVHIIMENDDRKQHPRYGAGKRILRDWEWY